MGSKRHFTQNRFDLKWVRAKDAGVTFQTVSKCICYVFTPRNPFLTKSYFDSKKLWHYSMGSLLRSQSVISNRTGGAKCANHKVITKCHHLSGGYKLDVAFCDFKLHERQLPQFNAPTWSQIATGS